MIGANRWKFALIALPLRDHSDESAAGNASLRSLDFCLCGLKTNKSSLGTQAPIRHSIVDCSRDSSYSIGADCMLTAKTTLGSPAAGSDLGLFIPTGVVRRSLS